MATRARGSRDGPRSRRRARRGRPGTASRPPSGLRRPLATPGSARWRRPFRRRGRSRRERTNRRAACRRWALGPRCPASAVERRSRAPLDRAVDRRALARTAVVVARASDAAPRRRSPTRVVARLRSGPPADDHGPGPAERVGRPVAGVPVDGLAGQRHASASGRNRRYQPAHQVSVGDAHRPAHRVPVGDAFRPAHQASGGAAFRRARQVPGGDASRRARQVTGGYAHRPACQVPVGGTRAARRVRCRGLHVPPGRVVHRERRVPPGASGAR